MAKYELRGGGNISGETAQEVLEAIRTSSFTQDADLNAFIQNLARRCKEYDGSAIRTDSPEHTVDDLIACGFMKLSK